MTNGDTFVFDPEGEFESKINKESVRIERLTPEDDLSEMRAMLKEHVQRTASAKATKILENWEASISSFWKVIPLAAEQIQKTKAVELRAVS